MSEAPHISVEFRIEADTPEVAGRLLNLAAEHNARL